MSETSSTVVARVQFKNAAINLVIYKLMVNQKKKTGFEPDVVTVI